MDDLNADNLDSKDITIEQPISSYLYVMFDFVDGSVSWWDILLLEICCCWLFDRFLYSWWSDGGWSRWWLVVGILWRMDYICRFTNFVISCRLLLCSYLLIRYIFSATYLYLMPYPNNWPHFPYINLFSYTSILTTSSHYLTRFSHATFRANNSSFLLIKMLL